LLWLRLPSLPSLAFACLRLPSWDERGFNPDVRAAVKGAAGKADVGRGEHSVGGCQERRWERCGYAGVQ
jgi:hypothetical protein